MRLQRLSQLLLVGAAVAVPPPFLLQGSQLNLPTNEAELPQFLNIERLKSKAEQVFDSLVDAVDEAVATIQGDVAQAEEEQATASPTAGLPPHHPPPVLDISSYTILEILNASLHHHPKHRHHFKADSEQTENLPPKWKLPWSPKNPEHHTEHDHDPKYLPLHRLAWFVNQSEEAQKALGRDGITLLAPDDFALRPPHRHQKHGKGPQHTDAEYEVTEGDGAMARAEIEEYAARQEEQEHQPIEHPFHLIAKSGRKCKKMKQTAELEGEKDDEEKKKLWAKIIAHVLEYHTLPEIRSERSLVDSSTVATTHDSERIKVEPTLNVFPHPHPSLKFNGYARKRGPTIIAKNGLIHLIGAPLLPPLSPLNQLFLFPQVFSTFTSGLQKVDLASKLLPSFEGGDGHDFTEVLGETESMVQGVIEELLKEHKELGSYTVFAPGNWAFNRLGPKILAFLHSPFSLSRHALKYVLAYHIVPDLEFFTDFIHNDTKGLSPSDAFIVKQETDVQVPFDWISHAEHPSFETKFPGPPPHDGGEHHPSHVKANLTHYRLPTLLSTSGENANATLRVVVIEHRQWGGHGPVQRSVVVLPHALPHHHQGEKEDFGGEKRGHPQPQPVKVFKTDLPARHGAIQWIESLLLPPFPHHNDEDDFASTAAAGGGHKKHNSKRMRKALAEMFASV